MQAIDSRHKELSIAHCLQDGPVSLEALQSLMARYKASRESFASAKVKELFLKSLISGEVAETITMPDPLETTQGSEMKLAQFQESVASLGDVMGSVKGKYNDYLTLRSSVPDDVVSLEGIKAAERSIEEKKLEVGALQSKLVSLKSKADGCRQYLSVLRDANETLKKTVVAAQGINDTNIDSNNISEVNMTSNDTAEDDNEERNTLRGMKSWYEKTNLAIAQIGGVSIDQYDNDNTMMVLKLNSNHSLVLQFGEDEASSLINVTLKPADVYVDDIAERAIVNNDLSLLVAEVRCRIMNYTFRRDEIQSLRSKVLINMNSMHDSVAQITTKDGIILSLNLSHDYPQPHARPVIEGIESFALGNDVVRNLASALVSSDYTTISSLLDNLDAEMNDVSE